MVENPGPPDGKLATQILLGGVVATLVCVLTSQFGFVWGRAWGRP